MDGARLSPLPHYSWFGLTLGMRPGTTEAHHCRDLTHTLAVGLTGCASIRWIRRGVERAYHHDTSQVAFFPSDGEHRVRILRSSEVPAGSFLLKIPERHLGVLVESDEGSWAGECRSLLPHDDSVLRECMLRLATRPDYGVAHDIGSEVASRRLVLRLAEVFGGRVPDWFRDESVFTVHVMNQIVDYIEARKSAHLRLDEFSAAVGLSPSHFAKKFRNTAGISLGRFVNRRRLAAALVMLTGDSRPLVQVALDLGFSSQSHFTRLFSALTGMTPAKYRKQFTRTAG